MVNAAPWAELLQEGKDDERLVYEQTTLPQDPYGFELPDGPDQLDPRVTDALRANGISGLYAHQYDALESAITTLQHDSEAATIVTTATASGKSLCFQLPTLQTLVTEPHARALYLYPTKALAQDQARALHSFKLTQYVRPAIYDGDTPSRERPQIRRKANLVITNPDMLHVGILPHHEQWGTFLMNLRIVVIDEAHVYRGVFGSHVANVIRRLRRVCRIHGSNPAFILTSATIANPGELAEKLTGLPEIKLIDTDSGPKPARQIAIWNPPLLDETLGTRASSLAEAAEILADLVSKGIKTICFMKSRKGVELILRMTQDRLRDDDPELLDRIAPYRAGYTPHQRHQIEAQLVSGELLAVVATDALELGIDIGQLDAAICVTFPGTVASLRQMWGRAGRRNKGLAIYVAGEDALDQFFARHPAEFLLRPVEAAIVDPESPEIRGAHLLCAALEAPITEADAGPAADTAGVLGPDVVDRARELVEAGLLRERASGFVLPRGDDYPAAQVTLRSSSADSFVLIDGTSGEIIGTIEAGRAYNTVHEGAIYLHMGRSYLVHELDLNARRALLEPFTGDYFTQPKSESMTFIETIYEQQATHGVTLNYGAVVYSETVLGYQRKHLQTQSVIDFQGLDMPTTEFSTRALWYELDAVVADRARGTFPSEHLLGALHALEHGQIAVLPLIAMCDRWDIGGLSTNAHPQTGGPTIFIYDGHPGGIGITRRGFEQFDRLVLNAQQLIGECRCKDGCPSCVQSPKCGNLNEPLHKAGALELIQRMVS
jgi:DEAD/DEAH box helicase domain-containing protein